MKYLYRGECEDLFQMRNGKLFPKKPYEKFAGYACAGAQHVVCGSGVQFGESDLNTVIQHQWAQAGIPTSGISSSPHMDRAKFYALIGGDAKKGYIFKLSVELLRECGVSIYRVNDWVPNPAVPQDDEHVLVAWDFGQIPESAIVEVMAIKNGI